MSTKLLRACAVLLALGAVTPALTRGQLPLFPSVNCCQTCYQPRPQCHCPTFRPVVETHMRPQSVMTWRSVQQTGYRCQPRVETVPVVTYQKRIRYDIVPYTVRRCVPQCSTVMVPERRVRYVPDYAVTSPVTTHPVPPAAWSHTGASAAPVPDPLFDSSPVAGSYGDWTTVSSRKRPVTPTPAYLAGDTREHDGGHHHHYRTTPVSHRRWKSEEKPFVRAPSAALVWQTPGPRY